jgi:TPR repeat protein
MADQFPVIRTASNTIATTDKKSSTLLGRGLAAIQNQQLAIADQDKLYRRARDVYNRITIFGTESRFNTYTLSKRSPQIDIFEAYQLQQLQPYFDKLQQLEDVFAVFKQLADKDYGKAYFPLAIMYCGGQGISVNIEKYEYYSQLAFDWCFANQRLNEPEIEYYLGCIYDSGFVAEHDDYEQSVFWYRKAAKQGLAAAQCDLSEMYANSGVVRDEEQVVYWCRKAADQGHAQAQYYLGHMYNEGYFVDQDYEQAASWFRKAMRIPSNN